MKNNLEILIETLQQEVDYLESEMKACAAELDFEAAELFRVSWIYTRQRWLILKNLENPNYNEIEYLKGQIRWYENQVNDGEEPASFKSRRRRRIQECKQKLVSLEGIKLPGFQDGDELIICIDKLRAGEITAFDLELEQMVLRLATINDDLQLYILPLVAGRLKSVIPSWREAQLREMGFKMGNKSAQAFLGKLSSTKTSVLLTLFSKIVFEVFNLYGGKEAVLRYEARLSDY